RSHHCDARLRSSRIACERAAIPRAQVTCECLLPGWQKVKILLSQVGVVENAVGRADGPRAGLRCTLTREFRGQARLAEDLSGEVMPRTFPLTAGVVG